MDWFLYDRNLRHERVKKHLLIAFSKNNFSQNVAKHLQKSIKEFHIRWATRGKIFMNLSYT